MTYDNIAIPTYLIGSLCNEFENHDEFDIVKTYSNSANQWQLFRNIIEDVGSGHDDDVCDGKCEIRNSITGWRLL